MRFLPQLEIRPSSTAPNPVEFGAAPPNCTVSLTSLAPHERLPEILVVPREKTPTGAAARACVVWKGFPAFPAHLRMRPVSRGNSRRATWVGPHAERPRFPGPPLRRTRGPDPSSKATLGGKAQHEGALPPPCIVRKDPRVPHTARRGA